MPAPPLQPGQVADLGTPQDLVRLLVSIVGTPTAQDFDASRHAGPLRIGEVLVIVAGGDGRAVALRAQAVFEARDAARVRPHSWADTRPMDLGD